MTTIRGIDVSTGRLTEDVLRGLPQFGALVQNLYPGGRAALPAIRRVAEANLSLARTWGWLTAGYIVASPWFSPEECLAEAKATAGSEWEHLRAIAVDMETMAAAAGQPVEFPPREAALRLLELCEEAKPGRVRVYTGRWFWRGYYGDDADPRWARWPLWVAYYDGIDTLSAPLFGPWREIWGKQYAGTTDVGVDADLDVFALEFFAERQMGQEGSMEWPIEPWTQEDDPIAILRVALDVAQAIRGLSEGWPNRTPEQKASLRRVREILDFYGWGHD